jgi:hypothetical protein
MCLAAALVSVRGAALYHVSDARRDVRSGRAVCSFTRTSVRMPGARRTADGGGRCMFWNGRGSTNHPTLDEHSGAPPRRPVGGGLFGALAASHRGAWIFGLGPALGNETARKGARQVVHRALAKRVHADAVDDTRRSGGNSNAQRPAPEQHQCQPNRARWLE